MSALMFPWLRKQSKKETNYGPLDASIFSFSFFFFFGRASTQMLTGLDMNGGPIIYSEPWEGLDLCHQSASGTNRRLIALRRGRAGPSLTGKLRYLPPIIGATGAPSNLIRQPYARMGRADSA